jgi:hypothetical protein
MINWRCFAGGFLTPGFSTGRGKQAQDAKGALDIIFP